MKKIFAVIVSVCLLMPVFGKTKFSLFQKKDTTQTESAESTSAETTESASAESDESASDESSDLDAIGDAIKNVGETIGSGIKSGVEKTGETIESKKVLRTTGILSVDKSSGEMTFTLTADDATYTVKPNGSSENARLKLSGFDGRKITVTGVLDKNTNEITLTSYKLATN